MNEYGSYTSTDKITKDTPKTGIESGKNTINILTGYRDIATKDILLIFTTRAGYLRVSLVKTWEFMQGSSIEILYAIAFGKGNDRLCNTLDLLHMGH